LSTTNIWQKKAGLAPPKPEEGAGSVNNKGINQIRDVLYRDKPGKLVISPNNADRAPSIIISDKGVTIVNSNAASGMTVDSQGTNLQGTVFLTSKAENLKKGEYSENPNSARIFTYQETVLLESIPKDVLSKATGQIGINLSTGMDGIFPIMTDIAAGPLPHLHTVSMKHVHRIDPAYLYRIPSAVEMIKGAMQQLTQFFKT